MRSIFTIIILLFVSASLQAQQFTPLKAAAGLGYAGQTISSGESGFLFYLEPGIRFSEKSLIGFRYEGCYIPRGVSNLSYKVFGGRKAFISSYSLFVQRCLNNYYFRPFFGIGAGIYQINNMQNFENANRSTTGTNYGFYPRIGADIGHFNMTLDYNFVSPSIVAKGKILNSYLAFKVGFSFGGGVGKLPQALIKGPYGYRYH
jgi:hypothetical protein